MCIVHGPAGNGWAAATVFPVWGTGEDRLAPLPHLHGLLYASPAPCCGQKPAMLPELTPRTNVSTSVVWRRRAPVDTTCHMRRSGNMHVVTARQEAQSRKATDDNFAKRWATTPGQPWSTQLTTKCRVGPQLQQQWRRQVERTYRLVRHVCRRHTVPHHVRRRAGHDGCVGACLALVCSPGGPLRMLVR
jgi:hypothetical protein